MEYKPADYIVNKQANERASKHEAYDPAIHVDRDNHLMNKLLAMTTWP